MGGGFDNMGGGGGNMGNGRGNFGSDYGNSSGNFPRLSTYVGVVTWMSADVPYKVGLQSAPTSLLLKIRL